MEQEWTCNSTEELEAIAKEILEISGEKKFALYGELGAGKTTLIKQFAGILGATEVVNSPSFTLVNEYLLDGGMIYHFDLYRVKEKEEIYDLGYEEYLYSSHYVFIEWAEKLEDLLPENFRRVYLELLPEGKRKVRLVS